jgi:miniconductance mechanosensitive channel
MESKKELTSFFYDLFIKWGINEDLAISLNLIASLATLFLAAYILSQVLRFFLKKVVRRILQKTKTKFDDYLFEHKFFFYVTYLVLLFFIRGFIPLIFKDFPDYIKSLNTFMDILIVVMLIWTVRSLLKTVNDYLKSLESFKDKPIDSYVQVFMIFAWLIGFVLVFSILTGETPWEFLTALGAVSAIILLIFKDSILGFVASIQVAANDTVRIGDWIAMPKFNADGDVIKISLNSILVKNWDKTVTSIPTYFLIQESFTNWRGMVETGGRRIKRSLIIQASSVRFLTLDEIQELAKVDLLKNHFQEFLDHMEDSKVEGNVRYTNLGVFRNYITYYLKQNPNIHQGLSLMCRQLDPTPQGLPLEIYAFSNDIRWVEYENIAGDIFEHLLAVMPQFRLRIYEMPSWSDFGGENHKHQIPNNKA